MMLARADDHDGRHPRIPPANAPTLVALLRPDLAIPAGSAGYVLDARELSVEVQRLGATDLVAELSTARNTSTLT
jgi:hypothetical protein